MEVPNPFEYFHQELTNIRVEIAALQKLLEKQVEDELIDLPAAAKFLHLKQVTLRKKVANGDIPYLKTGRKYLFSKAKLNEWLNTNNN